MRRPGWDLALAGWAREREGGPFVWGETDCASLVAEAAAVMYDDPPVRALDYTTLREATAAQKETGGVEAVLRDAGATEVGFWFRRTGDVILGSPDLDGDLPGAAVVVRNRAVVADADDGVLLRPLSSFSGSCTVLRMGGGR